MSRSMRRLSFDMTAEIEQVLDEFADKQQVTKGEALRRAIGLLSIAQEQKQKGNCLAVAREGEDDKLEPIGKIVGV